VKNAIYFTEIGKSSLEIRPKKSYYIKAECLAGLIHYLPAFINIIKS